MKCSATVRVNDSESRRCKAAAQKGKLYCATHQKQRDRLEWKRNDYCITINLKPYVRIRDGYFKKIVILKCFPSKEDAETYLHLIWGNLISTEWGHERRFVSACVELIPKSLR